MVGLDAKVSPVPIKEQMQTDDGVGTEGYIRFLNDLRGGVGKIVTDVNAQRKAKAGQIFDFAGIEAPIGALPCNGQLLLIADYQELYDVIGFNWGGSGDSFNIPNQEVDGVGVFRRGLSATSVVGEFINESVGVHTHTITIDPSEGWTNYTEEHTHSYYAYEPFDGYVLQYDGGVEPSYQIMNNTPISRDVTTENQHQHRYDPAIINATTDNNAGTETRPKAHVYLMCIWTGKAGSDDGIAVRAPRACEGDMCMATYDIDESGVVDDAEKVNGLTVEASVPLDAVFTDTLYDDTNVIKDADTNKPVTDLNKVATMEDIAAAGGGDMMKAIYDQDDSGIVDNAELVNGMTVETPVPTGAVFTDTVYDDTDVLKDADTSQPVTPTNPLATMDDLGSSGGDMTKAIYDTNDSGIVDDAELVNGLTVETAVPVGALFTDTPYDDTAVLKDADANKPVTPTNLLATMEDVVAGGGGDMAKSVYDADDSGVVDNAELVNGLSVATAVPAGAVFTDTIYNDSAVLKDADANQPVGTTNLIATMSDLASVGGGLYNNVKDFGAVGDGVADDTQAIKDAIAGSTRLYFPSGTYRKTAYVAISKDFDILMDFDAEIYGDLPAAASVTEQKIIVVDGGHRLTWRGGRIRGKGLDYAHNGLSVYDTKGGSTIEGLVVEGCEASGITLDGCTGTHIRDVQVSDCTSPSTSSGGNTNQVLGYGVAIYGGRGCSVRDSTFDNNRHSVAGGAWSDGVLVDGNYSTNSGLLTMDFDCHEEGRNWTFSNNTIVAGNGSMGGLVLRGDYQSAIGNKITGAGSTTRGIIVTSYEAENADVNFVQVIGNTVLNTDYGISLGTYSTSGYGIYNAVIEGNILSGMTYAGIYGFSACNNITIAGNIIEPISISQDCIRLAGGGSSNSVTGNVGGGSYRNGVYSTNVSKLLAVANDFGRANSQAVYSDGSGTDILVANNIGA